MRQFLTDIQKIEIVEKYINGKNCYELAKEYNAWPSGIHALLKRRNVKIRNDRKCRCIYSLNEEYFNIIDTQEKAYFLGFLYADGYNNEDRGTISISLIEDDVHFLEKFNEIICSNRPIVNINRISKDSNRKNQKRLSINSKKMSERLCEIGCVQAKSLILEFPNKENLSEQYYKDFIRGYFDGDGCFNVYLPKKRKCKNYCVNITSTSMFLEKVEQIIKNILNVSCSYNKRFKDDKPTTSLEISGPYNCFKFLHWIYDDATIFLQRKYDKFIIEKEFYEQSNKRVVR